MTTYAGVVRVSHMGDRTQGADDFHADRDQTTAIERALPAGATLQLLPPELDVSGGLPLEKRPSLMAAVEGVERGEYAGVIVAYLSRFGRNVREQLRAWDRIEAAGGRIICAAENIDTATPSGRFMRTVLLANAEREREEHQERFDNLKRWATESGIWQRRQTPTGYDRDPDTRRLVLNDRAPAVVRAFERRAAGVSLTEVAAALGMTRPGVRMLLQNRVYLGELHVKPYSNIAAHPPIVTRQQFEAAQVAQPRPPRSNLPPAMLTGLVFCAACGHRMSRKTGGNRGPHVYYCNGDRTGSPCREHATVSCHLLDAMVDPHGRAIMDHLEATSSTLDVDALRLAAEDADAETAAYVQHTSARTAGYSDGLRGREEESAQRWAAFRSAASVHPTEGVGWDDLDSRERNRVLRGAGLRIIVARAGAPFGRGVPLGERVCITTDHDAPPTLGVAAA